MSHQRQNPRLVFLLDSIMRAGYGSLIGAITEDEWQARVSLLLKMKARL